MSIELINLNDFKVQCELCTRWVSIDLVTIDDRFRLICSQQCLEHHSALYLKPQPAGVNIDGWDV